MHVPRAATVKSSRTGRRVPIVGIGASAGGLNALRDFFQHIPSGTGMAFVIVTHLPPGRESTLPEILGRFTDMPVAAAATGEAVKPDHVYVCPPDNILSLKKRRLYLAPAPPKLSRFPIDQFLVSLALDVRELAVGILLSGGGSDGSHGMRAIKEHGGFTLAQGHDGSAPMQSGMPDSAVAAGVVDLVLAVGDMGPRLVELAHDLATPEAAAARRAKEDDKALASPLRQISETLRDRLGHDFSGYKPRTFMRRVRRRMQILQRANIQDYIALLNGDGEEASLLFHDLLIGVTSFFRDPAAFEVLEELVIPRLFEGKGKADSVRVWVPACATGEEAYSIAILLHEHMDTLRDAPKIQLFATDIDEGALTLGRIGRYAAPALVHVSPERLERYFSADEQGYTVNKVLRDMCVFSVHNVLQDPPFPRLDLISCRNLLIYLGTELQRRVLPIFHFALRSGGFLFLGTSENITQNAELFATVDKKQRIFQRRDQVVTSLPLIQFTRFNHAHAGQQIASHDSKSMLANLDSQVQKQILERHTPAHVVVNRDGDVLYYSAGTGKYLEPAAGLPNRQLLAMARKGLRLELRTSLREAVETRRPVEPRRASIDVDDRIQAVDIAVEPFAENENEPLYLVVFHDVGAPVAPGMAPRPAATAGDKAVERLEQELRETRERLQSTVEEYETAVEELKSSNEELQSINEELQSTNEELETSKEELQAVNEELNAVNAELKDKLDELDTVNSDLRNVFESTQVAIVFLDRKLTIRSYTPAATAIFNLISSDRGRPLTDIVSNLEAAGDLRRDIQTVFERGVPIERRVQQADGKTYYMMRILPYRGDKGAVEGALIVFVDVTNLVAQESRQQELLLELNSGIRNTLDIIAALTREAPTKGETADEFAAKFSRRLRSIVHCYALLSRAHWTEVELRELLTSELVGFRRRRSQRVSLDGPLVKFRAPDALALAMTFHELASNAVQHGALSTSRGRLAVSWHIDHKKRRRLEIDWRESGGPPVKKPRANGFGADLITRALKGTLKGDVKMTYRPSGLQVRISVPLGANEKTKRASTK